MVQKSKSENKAYEYVDYTKKHYNNRLDKMLNSARTFEKDSEYNKNLYESNNRLAIYEEANKLKSMSLEEQLVRYSTEERLEIRSQLNMQRDKDMNLEIEAKNEFEMIFNGPNAKLKEQGKNSQVLIELYKILPIMARIGISAYTVMTALSVFRTLRISKHIGTNTYMRVPDRLLAYRCHLSRNNVDLMMAALTKTDLIKKVKFGNIGEMYVVLNEKLICNDELFIEKHKIYHGTNRGYMYLLSRDNIGSFYFDPVSNPTKAKKLTEKIMFLTFAYNRFITPEIYRNTNRDQQYEHRSDILYAKIPIRMLSSILGLSQAQIMSHIRKITANCSWMKLHKLSYSDNDMGSAYYDNLYQEREKVTVEEAYQQNNTRTRLDEYCMILFPSHLNEARWYRKYKKEYKFYEEYMFRWIYYNMYLPEENYKDDFYGRYSFLSIYKQVDPLKLDTSEVDKIDFKFSKFCKDNLNSKYGRDESYSFNELDEMESGKIDLYRQHRNRYKSFKEAQIEDAINSDNVLIINVDNITTNNKARGRKRVKLDKLISALNDTNIEDILPIICKRINYIIKDRMGYDLNKNDVKTADVTHYTNLIIKAQTKIKQLYSQFINKLDIKESMLNILTRFELLSLI